MSAWDGMLWWKECMWRSTVPKNLRDLKQVFPSHIICLYRSWYPSSINEPFPRRRGHERSLAKQVKLSVLDMGLMSSAFSSCNVLSKACVGWYVNQRWPRAQDTLSPDQRLHADESWRREWMKSVDPTWKRIMDAHPHFCALLAQLLRVLSAKATIDLTECCSGSWLYWKSETCPWRFAAIHPPLGSYFCLLRVGERDYVKKKSRVVLNWMHSPEASRVHFTPPYVQTYEPDWELTIWSESTCGQKKEIKKIVCFSRRIPCTRSVVTPSGPSATRCTGIRPVWVWCMLVGFWK